MSPRDKKTNGLRGLFKAVRSEPQKPTVERRSSKRVELPLAVQISFGERDPREAHIRDVNLPGMCLAPAGDAQVGETVMMKFDGFSGVCPAFFLIGRTVRIMKEEDGEDGVAITIDRKATPPEAMKHYRSLVLHYVRHRPLLEDMNRGYFEGRCTACDWVGRVGKLTPRCPHCSEKVSPI